MTEKICGFCGKAASEVEKIIKGNNVFICNECVDLCYKVLEEQKSPLEINFLSPDEIKEHLDQYVIGQEEAKKTLSVAVYNHYKRINNPVIDDVEIEKSNLMFVGPTGVGKTFLVKTIARILNVPFAIADATSLTESGYVGDDIESILSSLYQAANFDIEKAQHGIIYIDEIDKKSKKSENLSITRDVSGEGVQQGLLKIVEGSECKFTPSRNRKNPEGDVVTINTTNILFIVGGAFIGLEDIIKERKNIKPKIGFSSEEEYEIDTQEITSEDLRKFGMIPEFVGRFPQIAVLNELTVDDLCHIMKESKTSVIKQFVKMFKVEGIDLIFKDELIHAIAEKCIELGTGARAIRGIVEKLLLDTQFDIKKYRENGAKEIILGENMLNGGNPVITFEEKKETSNG